MAGPWRTPRRPVAGVAATVLVLLCLIASSLLTTGAWSTVNDGSGRVWSQSDAGADVSSLPPQTGAAREHHAPSSWPLRGGFHDAPAYQPLVTPSAPDTDEFRDPQRPAHRTAGPRSPPGA
ncbi:hypothetical protein [Herbidospora sp. NBRC 101105]|uniref:hypothetical protein n=1 Tax=Herbidospora sp. NBRC 101105 TaxID=3032195 RepID=UPI0024A31C58|nr:hypothetical protein [Herbidospora sp. NBRC 101105]GLX93791.1 hypothetical protein Hesp01_17410 [Herbidospora sp. NBRC 101105]